MRGTNLNLMFGNEIIYDNADFQLNSSDKAGIIGVNGAGKTTLFRVLLHEIQPDSGEITTDHARIGYLPQEVVIDDVDETVIEYLEQGRPITALQNELDALYKDMSTADAEMIEDKLEKAAKIQEQLDYYECYEADVILRSLITRMQIPEEILNQKIKNLSGGQKSKIAFVRVLYSKPEILMLDEPTNHLDATTKNFITEYLKQYKGMVLIISHDIDFLNQIINKVLFLNKTTHKISVYEGDYNTYLKRFEQEKEIQERLITQQEKEIASLQELVQRSKQASATNHHLKRLGHEREARLLQKKQEQQVREREYKRVKMDLTPRHTGAKVPLTVKGLCFHYPKQSNLYEELSFVINGGERFLVVGENGIGKSTLLKLLMDILHPQEGNIEYNTKTEAAYYAQELELLDADKSVLENVDFAEYTELQLRSILGNFLFYGDDVFKKVAVLSPGEKARVALCRILLQKANLLVLDEPTNHLDPQTQDVIGENLSSYPGTIIAVSHNNRFVEQIGIDRMLVLPSGKIDYYSREKLEKYSGMEEEL